MSATSAAAAASAASSSDGSRRAAASCPIAARLPDAESLIVFDRTKGTIRVFRSEGFLTDGWIYAWRRAEYPPGEGGAKNKSAGRIAGALLVRCRCCYCAVISFCRTETAESCE